MNRYIDWADVAARYADVAADIGAERAVAYIEDAEAEVDARLAPRYTVPFANSTSAPQMVRTLSIDLAYYRLIWASDRADKLKTYIDARFDALLAGSMALVSSGTGAVADNFPVAWATNTYRSSFGPDDAENWSPSWNAQYDAALERDYD